MPSLFAEDVQGDNQASRAAAMQKLDDALIKVSSKFSDTFCRQNWSQERTLPHKITGWNVNKQEHMKVVYGGNRCLQQQQPSRREDTFTYERMYDNDCMFWIIPIKENKDKVKNWGEIKKWLPPVYSSNDCQRIIIFMGVGDGYAWYAFMPIHQWLAMSKDLGLTGGDDKIQAAITGTMFCDRTRDECLRWLGGTKAEIIPYLDRMNADYFPMRKRIILSLTSNDPKVTTWLLEHTGDKDEVVASAARRCLLNYPRPQVVEYYLKQLDENIGKADSSELLLIIQKLDVPDIDKYYRKIYDNPQSLHEYKIAVAGLRKKENKPYNPRAAMDVKCAMNNFVNRHHPRNISPSEIQEQIDIQAKAVASNPDKIAAMLTALSMMTYGDKGDNSALNKAGEKAFSILKDDPEVRRELKKLYPFFSYEFQRKKLDAILKSEK